MAGGLLFLATLHDLPAWAGKLGAEECSALREQRKELEQKGVGKNLLKGAEWAAVNLNAGQIRDVGTFLQILEKIKFRCDKSPADAKSRFGLLANIPLPVRNSLRMKQRREAEKAADLPSSNGTGLSKETKSVLTAVTKKDAPSGKKAGRAENGPSGAAKDTMRKALDQE